MVDALREFLAPLRPEAREHVQWGDISLLMASYVHDPLPPLDFVTSVRAVVLTPIGVAVLHNPDEAHVLPGGRLEDGEDLLTALQREVLAETGCRPVEPVYLGFIHFRHQTPKPANYLYPYPDFLQIVYATRAEVEGEAADPTGWEKRVEFVPWKRLGLDHFQRRRRCFLKRVSGLFARLLLNSESS